MATKGAKKARVKRSATHAMAHRTAADPPCTGWLPLPDCEKWSPRAAAKWIAENRWHALIDSASQDANAEERAALGALTYWMGEATRAATEAIRTGAPVAIESNLGRSRKTVEASDLRHLALVLRAAARFDHLNASEEIQCGAELQALAEAIIGIADRGVRADAEAWRAEVAERKARPSRQELFDKSADLEDEARRLRQEAEREEDEELERLRPLVAAKVAPKRARAARLDYEAAAIAHTHFDGPKPAPLAAEGA